MNAATCKHLRNTRISISDTYFSTVGIESDFFNTNGKKRALQVPSLPLVFEVSFSRRGP
ncbi:hypothetical protein SAMN04487857_102443 [Pseudomonas sp. ok272]|nr:hypothetical protein SAMN04487857_102443 [Pseudomonas sp. ok272]SFM24408.1 hypothetical protein SAMN04487858_101445 [Pseudomonas sp. ok602]